MHAYVVWPQHGHAYVQCPPCHTHTSSRVALILYCDRPPRLCMQLLRFHPCCVFTRQRLQQHCRAQATAPLTHSHVPLHSLHFTPHTALCNLTWKHAHKFHENQDLHPIRHLRWRQAAAAIHAARCSTPNSPHVRYELLPNPLWPRALGNPWDACVLPCVLTARLGLFLPLSSRGHLNLPEFVWPIWECSCLHVQAYMRPGYPTLHHKPQDA
jgi:hypothetical protein